MHTAFAWKLMTCEEPPEVIDHIDRDKSNNRWDNLRNSDWTRNQGNRICKGVYKKRWGFEARGAGKYLGVFRTEKRPTRLTPSGTFRISDQIPFTQFKPKADTTDVTPKLIVAVVGESGSTEKLIPSSWMSASIKSEESTSISPCASVLVQTYRRTVAPPWVRCSEPCRILFWTDSLSQVKYTSSVPVAVAKPA